MSKQKIYYGYNINEDRVMFAAVTGKMCDGTTVYTECTGTGDLIDIDKQYTRHIGRGWQIFCRL